VLGSSWFLVFGVALLRLPTLRRNTRSTASTTPDARPAGRSGMAAGDWKDMFLAACDGDVELVRCYVEKGVDVDYTPPSSSPRHS
jgi:hypothetical protein